MSASRMEDTLQVFSPRQKAPDFLKIEEKHQFTLFIYLFLTDLEKISGS